MKVMSFVASQIHVKSVSNPSTAFSLTSFVFIFFPDRPTKQLLQRVSGKLPDQLMVGNAFTNSLQFTFTRNL